MMTLANYGIGSSKQKDPNSAKVLSKSLQVRTRAELMLKQHLKSHFRVTNDKRNEIFNLINDYYSRIPFNVLIWNKYQTKQCIIDSILLLDSRFNPYKAREAFRLIEKMLINLVYLPWHKEFRRIHTYSGQYRLSISDPLLGVEELFRAAGFRPSTDSSMELVLPETKMPQVDDAESVTGVIFDCMIAQVVCTNIIEVFDNCCKQAKHCEEVMKDINYYSWIQAYFRERSHQTTERACTNIQELLNNLTNHLSKLDLTILKAPESSNHQSSTIKSQPLSNSDRVRGSPKLNNQDRTRDIISQRSREDEDKTITLPSDLLRIPTAINGIDVGNKRQTNSNKHGECEGLLNQHQLLSNINRQINNETGTQQLIASKQFSHLNNGYHTNHYHKQALYDRAASSSRSSQPTLNETCDLVDSYHCNGATNNIYRNSNDSLSHPSIELDLSHNDREPLIPRYNDSRVNRAPATHHHQQPTFAPKRSLHDNDFEPSATNHHHLTKTSGILTHPTNRQHFDDVGYFNDSTSHPSQLSSTHQSSKGSSLLKYNNSSYRKYESRDNENKLMNSRSFWSCGSCTYNNQICSEICEMCRTRRPSH